ncbi:hypothetical protein [Oceaniserpentilla sp. 4NH20-0058]|uniref:hypothetical protein n=1 Tax=Oceaniserpentilla sp. 4NH20-0058 TaxID=3127660 RepID=UPI003341F963
MNKFVVIGTVVICFISYGLWPLAASSFLLLISDDPIIAFSSVALWSVAVLVQVVAMWQIFKRNLKGLHLFFSVIFLYVVLFTGDEIIVYFESEATTFPFFSILNKAVFPLIAAWVLYYSDAKDFFQHHNRE